MKRLIFLLTVLILPLMADGPQPLPFHALTAGVGYNSGLSKHVVPDISFWQQMGSSGMYSITEAQVVGVNRHPFQAQTVLSTGVCEARTLGEYFVVGACGQMGVSSTGTAVGGVGGAGGFAEYRFGKSQHFGLGVRGGVLQTAIGGASNPVLLYVKYGFK